MDTDTEPNVGDASWKYSGLTCEMTWANHAGSQEHKAFQTYLRALRLALSIFP
jgi:hypothetical protein